VGASWCQIQGLNPSALFWTDLREVIIIISSDNAWPGLFSASARCVFVVRGCRPRFGITLHQHIYSSNAHTSSPSSSPRGSQAAFEAIGPRGCVAGEAWDSGCGLGGAPTTYRRQRARFRSFEMMGNGASGHGWLAGGVSPLACQLDRSGVTNGCGSSSHLPGTLCPLTMPV
jgi:hypothetical protein